MYTATEIWRAFSSVLKFRRDSGPLNTVAGLEDFVVTRAAFIAQKTLYGYVKTRMGIRYPEMFRDDVIIRSVNIAKLHHFDACLADLSIYAAAHALAGSGLDDDAHAALATRMHATGLARNADPTITEFSPEAALARFRDRAAATDWRGRAGTRENFTACPDTLVKWAPIADELKVRDEEIVRNSILFAWIDIWGQFQRRLDADAVAADYRRRPETVDT